MTVQGIQAKYATLYRNHTDLSQIGKGQEKAYLDLKLELAEIATLPSKAAQKRQLQRMISCYEALLPDSDPVFNAKYETLREAATELKQIKTFVVIAR